MYKVNNIITYTVEDYYKYSNIKEGIFLSEENPYKHYILDCKYIIHKIILDEIFFCHVFSKSLANIIRSNSQKIYEIAIDRIVNKCISVMVPSNKITIVYQKTSFQISDQKLFNLTNILDDTIIRKIYYGLLKQSTQIIFDKIFAKIPEIKIVDSLLDYTKKFPDYGMITGNISEFKFKGIIITKYDRISTYIDNIF